MNMVNQVDFHYSRIENIETIFMIPNQFKQNTRNKILAHSSLFEFLYSFHGNNYRS